MKVLQAVLVITMWAFIQAAWTDDALYRCADGTFTNRVERQCALYKARGIVRVQGGSAEAGEAAGCRGEGLWSVS